MAKTGDRSTLTWKPSAARRRAACQRRRSRVSPAIAILPEIAWESHRFASSWSSRTTTRGIHR